jgi:hypothetical protein
MKPIITVCHCIPFIVLLVYVLYPVVFVIISNSALGKLFAVFCIIYYTCQHFVYGLTICTLVILYYCKHSTDTTQTESFNDHLSTSYQQHLKHLPKSADRNTTFQNIDSTFPLSSCKVNIAYPHKIQKIKKESEDIFRQQYCKTTNVMKYKNLDVKHHDMSHHLTEIEFNDGVCNPCDKTCHFSLRKQKEIVENDLTPENSRSFFTLIPDKMRQLFLFNSSGEPFVGGGSYLQT